MKFKDIVKRVNGFSILGVGVSWDSKNTDKDFAQEIIAFLEDRRVLYSPCEMEMPHHCVKSVLEMRHFFTEHITRVRDEDLRRLLQDMRAACRKFMDTVGAREEIVPFGQEHGHWASWEFNGAVGELRGVCGLCIAKIALKYKMDIENDLASILPVYKE